MTVDAILKSELWWRGPEFLRNGETEWPTWQPSAIKKHDEEEIQVESRKAFLSPSVLLTCTAGQGGEGAGDQRSVLNSYENLRKVLRITAYVRRFITDTKKRVTAQKQKLSGKPVIAHDIIAARRSIPVINTDEYQHALRYWIKYSQKEAYGHEYRALTLKKELANSNPLRKCAPFLDEDGLMRLQGRTMHADIPYDQKHPYILSGKSELARRLMAEAHIKTMHGNLQVTMQYL